MRALPQNLRHGRGNPAARQVHLGPDPVLVGLEEILEEDCLKDHVVMRALIEAAREALAESVVEVGALLGPCRGS